MSEVTDFLQKVTSEVKADVSAVETMAVNTAKDAASKIVPAVWGAVGDAMIAAETAYAADTGVDKYAAAFAGAATALENDGIKFVESEINYAIETFVQARNAALAAPAAPSDAQTDPVDPTAAPTG